MNVGSLIQGSPELIENLQALGLSADNVDALGAEITAQLGGDRDTDLSRLLTSMSGASFAERLDIDQVADRLLISPLRARQAVKLVGGVVDGFGINRTGLFGRLADSLFSR